MNLSEEQLFLRDSVAGAIARGASPGAVRAWLDGDDLTAADALAASSGWTGLGLDEDLGGQGGGVEELAVLAEQLGRGAVPWDRTLAACLAGPLLAQAGPQGRKAAERNAEGERTAALCVAGDRPFGPAEVSLEGDRLTARIPWVLGATAAQELVVPCIADEGIALLAVDRDATGVAVAPRRLVDRTRSLADVVLEEAPFRNLGRVDASALASTSSVAAILVAADSLGAMSRLLELTTEYVAERRQFGVVVGSFQAVKHAAAQMLVDVEGARSAVQYSAWASGADLEDSELQASIAKSFTADAGVRVADRALFLHGAIGYTWEHDLQFLFKRVKSNALLLGSADTHRELIYAGMVAAAT